jgi:hypothetical protein
LVLKEAIDIAVLQREGGRILSSKGSGIRSGLSIMK